MRNSHELMLCWVSCKSHTRALVGSPARMGADKGKSRQERSMLVTEGPAGAFCGGIDAKDDTDYCVID